MHSLRTRDGLRSRVLNYLNAASTTELIYTLAIKAKTRYRTNGHSRECGNPERLPMPTDRRLIDAHFHGHDES
ncbi:MAG: hypothetical protein AAFY26_12920 [Cyanobacteria bacterium J06638_22]